MFRGIVSGIISGDTLVVRQFIGGKRSDVFVAVSLEKIQCPKIGTTDGRVQDEPFAWQAYNFTRGLAIGQRIEYYPNKAKVDIKRHHPNFGALQVTFARVKLVDKGGKDLGLAVVEAGYGKVRNQKEQKDDDEDYIDSLKLAQEEASSKKIGMWSENQEGAVRKLPVQIDNKSLLKKKDFDAIVQTVINGSMFNVWLLPNFEYITLQLAGVRAPSAKRNAPELYGIESKNFSEDRLVERVVKVSLYEINENGNFVGRILHPKGDIAVFLVSEGLAQMVNQTAALIPNSEEIRAAETRAKENQKNIWKNFDKNILRTSRIDGKVVGIRGSNSIEVNNGVGITRLWLSCCKVPQYNPQGAEPFGLEAREKLRKMLIGKKVQCVVDYKVDDRSFATVYLGNECVNELLIKDGLATCLVSKNNNPSERIDSMLRAEKEAASRKRKIHSNERPNTQLNDLSNKHTRQRSVPYLHYFENKVVTGVIEYFASPTRIVVLIPDQHCIVRLNLQGIVAADTQERIGAEALAYCNDNYLFRDVELKISSVDKVGCFNGNVTVISEGKRINLEVDLLSKGFTEIHKPSISKCQLRNEMEAAEKKAASEKVGVWATKVGEPEMLEEGKVYSVSVVDVCDPATIIVQIQSPDLEKINNGLKQANLQVGKIMRSDLVAAIYNNKLYRGKVLEVDNDKKKAVIEFLELATEEEISFDKLRVLPSSIATIPAQALIVRLGGLKPFKLDDSFNDEAMEFLWNNVNEADLYAHLMYNDDYPSVLLTDSESINSGSLNSLLLSEGLVHGYYPKLQAPFDEILNEFEEIENEARNARKGAWVHGNIAYSDSDDEDEGY